MLQRISEIMYEDDIKDIPSPPDVSNYLVSEVSGSSFSCVLVVNVPISVVDISQF